MSYLDWKVGMEVVCIDDAPSGDPSVSPEMDGLTAGHVYTIREITTAPDWYPRACELTIKLVEIVRDRGFFPDELGYRISRFRPVQKRKTDISIFQRLLTNPNIRIEETV